MNLKELIAGAKAKRWVVCRNCSCGANTYWYVYQHPRLSPRCRNFVMGRLFMKKDLSNTHKILHEGSPFSLAISFHSYGKPKSEEKWTWVTDLDPRKIRFATPQEVARYKKYLKEKEGGL